MSRDPEAERSLVFEAERRHVWLEAREPGEEARR